MTVKRWVPVGDFRLGPEERQAVMRILEQGRVSEYQRTAEFERRFAEYVGARHCCAVNSGTSALIVMLKALQHLSKNPARAGTKVVTSPLTYIATPAAVIAAGFEPVFVDVDPTRFGILPEAVAETLDRVAGQGFAALLPVHLMGYPADMDRLGEIAGRYGLRLLEDSAQAHGTEFHGRRTGSIGLAGAFSFYIAHNIQAGEMGAVTTSDAELAELVRSLKAHGRRCRCPVCLRPEGRCPYRDRPEEGDPRFTHDFIGYNFKVTEFQAALGLCQLRRADAIFAARQRNVSRLNELLAPLRDDLATPPLEANVSYLAYPLVLAETAPLSRERLRHELEAAGVENRPLFSCLPTQQPAFAHLRGAYLGRLPNAERLGRQAFYVGCHQYLTDDDLEYVAATIRRVFDRAAGGSAQSE